MTKRLKVRIATLVAMTGAFVALNVGTALAKLPDCVICTNLMP